MASLDQNGLPAAIDCERFVIGSVLLDGDAIGNLSSAITEEDFHLERHKRIWKRVMELFEAGRQIDRVTVTNELLHHDELESIGGMTYLVELDDGLPRISNLDSYVQILQQKSALRRLIRLAHAAQLQALSGEDAGEITRTLIENLSNAPRGSEREEMQSPAEVIESAGGLGPFLSPEVAGRAIITPWPALTILTTGFRTGELIIIGANASMGKTASALQIASFASEHGNSTHIYSLEMPKQSIVNRMLCERASVDSHRLRSGFLTSEERRRLQVTASTLTKWPLRIDDKSRTLANIRVKVRRERPALVVIDYLQLMGTVSRHANRNLEIGEITRGCKLMAGEFDCVVLLLSQLSRDNAKDGRPPRLSDLRESGNIEQDADMVIFPWRPEVIRKDRPELRGVAQMILEKQRNGPVGTVEMTWYGPYMRFAEAAQGEMAA